jgi:hypothetical protein
VGIDAVDGVVSDVGVEVGVAAVEGDGVFGGPASELWVVVACAEAGEAGVGVEEAAGEAEGVEEGVAALGGDAAEGVEVAGLDDVAVMDPDDAADGADVVGDEGVEDVSWSMPAGTLPRAP